MMTQAFLSSTNMDQMKMTFDDVYCETEVDTLQIGCDTDSCTLSKTHDDEKSKENEKPKNSEDNVNTFHAARRNEMKRKPRRQRTKSARQAPYSMSGNKEAVTKVQKSRRIRAQAPDNTTQFLMGDMDNWNKWQEEDGDNCYAKREFSKEYEKMAISKQKMPKSKLIEEYLYYESEVKALEKKYEEMTAQVQLKARLGAVENEWENGEIFMEPEVAEKIRIFQSEIAKVREENLRLGTENRDRDLDEDSSSSSSDEDSNSSSDSDSSGSSSDDSDSDSSSSEEEEEAEADRIPIIEEEQSVTSTDGEVAMAAVPEVDTMSRIPDDTGYESGGSSNDAARVSSTTLRK